MVSNFIVILHTTRILKSKRMLKEWKVVCCCFFVFNICSTFMYYCILRNQKKSYFSTRTEKARCTDPSQRDKLKMGRSRAISLPRNVFGLNFFVLHHNHSNVVSVLKYIHICVFVCIFWSGLKFLVNKCLVFQSYYHISRYCSAL